MKKITFIGVTTLLVLASCAKENSVTDEQETFVPQYLTASLEQENTKATLNNSLQTVWQTGDVIGVYVTNYKDPAEWDWDTVADCSLSAGQGTTVGTFNAPSYDSSNRWCFVAFYPRVAGTAQQYKMKFNLPVGYYDYTSGMNLLPMMADMSGGEDRPSDVSFKHVGGGVKISVNDVPGNANSIGMTVAGKKITGAFDDLEPTTAGTSSGKLVATTSSSDDQTVYLNFATASGVRDFDFIFPVPTVTSPDLTFTLWSNNDLQLWSKTASDQPSIGRAELLEFPVARTITASKVATHVLANNTFDMRGWNVEGDGADYDDDDYSFSSTGSLSHTFSSLAYINVQANGHYYQAENNAHYFGSYVDFNPETYFGTGITTGSLGIILNYGDGNAQTENGSISISSSNVYYVRVYESDGKYYVESYNPEESNYTGMSTGLSSGNKRIWIRADGPASFNGLGITNAHLWSDSSTTWPGLSVSKDKTLAANPVTLSTSYASSDKVAIPAGTKTLSIAYNEDGTLTLSY